MAMTREERATRDYLAEKLGEQGYATYAKLFLLFELRLTSDPRVVGYMKPEKGRITINRTLAEHQMGLIIRHEILHEYLDHEMRLLDHLAEIHPELAADEVSLKKLLYSDRIFNKAADYEISNRGYTEQDKKDVRAIQLGSRIVTGLVTEDEHPDWVNLTVEEMYDLLKDEREKAKQEAKQEIDQNQQGQSTEGESQDEGKGAEGDPGDNSNDGSDDGSGDDQSDEQHGSGTGGSGDDSDDESEDDQSDEQYGRDTGGSGDDSGDDSDDDPGDEPYGSDTGDSGDDSDGNDSGGSQGSGGTQPRMRVIRGTMKDGKFYDLNGNEIRPGG